MNGYGVLLWLRERIRDLDLPSEATSDLRRALSSGGLEILDFCYLAGCDASLEEEVLFARASGVYCNYIAGNLADDLADGDCSYLDRPYQTGPATQFLLQNLAYQLLCEGGLSPSDLLEFSSLLVHAGGAQSYEVRTHRWSMSLVQDAAERFGADQYNAYLRAMWSGTPLQDQAHEVGRSLGIVGFIALDIASEDLRYTSMSPGERVSIRRWASNHFDTIAECNLSSVSLLLLAVTETIKQSPV